MAVFIVAQQYGLAVFGNETDVVGHFIANAGRCSTLLQLRDDVLYLDAVEVGKWMEIDQGRRFQVTEPDAGGFKQPKLAAGIDATDRCTRCHLECLFDPFESFALRDNAPVQVNGVFAGGQAGQEMVEGDHTLDFDVRDIQCVTARQNMLSTDVAMLILDFPQMVKQFGALEGEVFVWSAGCRCFFLVHSHFLSHLRAGFRKHCTPRKNPLVGAG